MTTLSWVKLCLIFKALLISMKFVSTFAIVTYFLYLIYNIYRSWLLILNPWMILCICTLVSHMDRCWEARHLILRILSGYLLALNVSNDFHHSTLILVQVGSIECFMVWWDLNPLFTVWGRLHSFPLLVWLFIKCSGLISYPLFRVAIQLCLLDKFSWIFEHDWVQWLFN